ncbi:MICAL-like protein 2 [Dufourea novaeangliae]|uniref:MICAL-like protein 2 n=1 Tax=Dufourea novaeangliae TaxID=178035 RepID=A0A154P5Y9_DUFNO|nr:MICAL-like protein 2 [Dufourea novaeangliae]
MGEKRGTKALELWCRRITEGYPGVNVQNMTTSWKDGLAFCAMIHHFRPELIDFDSLDKNDVYRNNELAFRTAEQHLGIPALLDAEDMASCSVPDRLSILTYLSQFYQTFVGSSPNRPPVNRTTKPEDERITPVSESPKQKVVSCLGVRRDSCIVCGLPVFLAEKLVVARLTYHRTCFRCARCSNQLTHGNYYETEAGGFCCETCPDEGISSSVIQKYNEIPKCGDTSGKTEEDDDTVTDSSDQESLSEETDRSVRSRTSFPVKMDENNGQNDDFSGTYSKLESQNREEEDMIERDGICVMKTDDVGDKLNCSMKTEEQKFSVPLARAVNKDKSISLVTKTNNTEELLGHTDEDEESERCLSLVQKRLKLFEAREKEDHTRIRQSKPQSTEERKSKIHNNGKVETVKEDRAGVKVELEEINGPKVLDDGIRSPKINRIEGTEEENSLGLVRKNSGKLSSEATEPVSTEESDISSNVKNLNIQESNKNVTTVSEASSAPPWKLSTNTVTVNTDEESSEDQTVPAPSVEQVNECCEKDSDLNVHKDYQKSLNPFSCDDDEEEDVVDNQSTSTDNLKSSNSTNPFENEETEEAEEKEEKKVTPPIPAKRSNFSNSPKQEVFTDVQTKRRLAAPKISLNPFWSDDDDHDSDLEYLDRTPEHLPVPKPRTMQYVFETKISIALIRILITESGGTPGVISRKKKPAPLPPSNREPVVTEQQASLVLELQKTSSEYHNSYPRTTPKARKAKPAPPPPMPTSTPCHTAAVSTLSLEESPIIETYNITENTNLWEDKKTNKDELNRSKQTFTHISCGDNSDYHSPYTDKSTQGKWKRKKGPAPPCPIPHRRKIKVMSLKDVKLELDEIELQQQGLEKQGVRLEQLIRNKCETGSNNEVSEPVSISDVSLGTDVEELVLELFALVNEKNELFRRQAELMLLRRQQRLEEEHVEVEYQIRCLMSQNESTKTDFEKQKEEALIQRLVQIVEKRNEIVECLEMDRRREIEEDRSIHKHMGLLAAKTKNDTPDNDLYDPCCSRTKKGKPKKKTKEKKSKRLSKKDIDKDIDETEVKQKRHNKRKWF